MKTPLILVLTLSLTLTSCGAHSTPAHPDTTHYSPVVSPEIPHSVTFAGDTIHFDRYDLRERIDRELISFCYMHSTTLLMLKRANRYLPEVEQILRAENIPDDFKYLMLIESNANPLSLSAVGAAGLWQFMPATAKEYGLEITTTVDERYHIAKSTHAACRYLRDAYQKTGTWLSAAASYNAGQNRIVTQLARQDADNALDLYLNSETSRYIFRIMAAKIIMTTPATYGFDIRTDQLYPPHRYRTEQVDTPIDTLAQWAKTRGITYAQLRDANPWLRSHQLVNKTGKKYEIRILTPESIHYDPRHTPCCLPHCH